MMRRFVGPALQAGLIVAVFVVVGALAGVVWERLWSPPTGVVFRGDWFLDPAGPDHGFAGTGWYVVVALVAGGVTAFVLGWFLPRRELTSLVAFAIGSMLAGWVMFKVGHALGPPDPRILAAGETDYTRLPSDLRLAGADADPLVFTFDSSALAAFPTGAMLAAVYVFLLTSRSRRT
ncbi:hypothetical protein [Nocardioides piscis]|uniref:DUF2567 domain-containing protein n=1 Tax=Nocardioides piscis TaxID=2714938 RepID=A0A6G7YJ86_9ACTN|nr:hypothetical protein [Nocardioides piscis]QIK76811.1 hypothetical protein G7071_16635 [Nocardioides piscis]